MQGYKEYKETNAVWIERIPKHWSMRKTKHLFRERIEKGFPDEPLLVASQNMGVVPKDVYGARTVEATKDLHLLKLVKKSDFVISLRSFQGGIEYAYYQGIISPAYTIMVTKGELSPAYFKHLAKSKLFIELLKLCVTGIREGQNIDYERLKNHFLPVPPREEQDKIVQFLDHKLEKIHKFIANKQKLIALLEEQKQAIINQAVTKGLDPNAPMKHSGIDWLGEVPKHWEVMRCKYLFNERNERSEHGDETHLSMSQKHGLVPDDRLDEKRMLSESYAGGKLCYENDIVLNRLKAHLGVFALSKQTGVISPDYTVLIVNTNKLHAQFTELLLKSNPFRKELRIRVRGVVEGFWRLYTEDFNTIYFPFPSLSEQERIVEHLKVTCAKSDTLIAKYQKEIDLIQEYKTSLISSVVTGQVDVGNIKATGR